MNLAANDRLPLSDEARNPLAQLLALPTSEAGRVASAAVDPGGT